MFRKQFIGIVTSTGMATSSELRPLILNESNEQVSEFNLLELPNFDEDKFAKSVAQKYELKFIDLSSARIPSEVVGIMSKKQVLRFRAIPIQRTAQKITLCVFDPTVNGQVGELQMLLKAKVELLMTTISCWKKVYDEVQESVEELLNSVEIIGADGHSEDTVRGDEIPEDIIIFVNKLLVESFLKKVSDIHIENYEKFFRIRIRIDGILVEYLTPPKSYQLPVVSRVKIMAAMDIAERRFPQDGRIKLRVSGKAVDFRVSSLPTLYGEKIVLRILDQSNLQLNVANLGFEKKQLEDFTNGISKPYGMCLIVGPTGSGKTTTLYSALSMMNSPEKNITTVEDPIEFNLEGINQVNVKEEIDFTFATALKSFLRQDPDIIMVGEVRDLEVGKIAVEAALTGHLVLSTLHTNDAPSTIVRLLNMGIEPFMLIASLNVIVAQRLCRKICDDCKKEFPLPIEDLVRLGFSEKSAKMIKTFKGEGCEKCGGTGCRGRLAIYEVLPVTMGLRDAIIHNSSADDLRLQAMKEGMKTLRMSALIKVAQGLIPVEEAIKNSASDKKS